MKAVTMANADKAPDVVKRPDGTRTFTDGNTAALTHGAGSPRAIEAKAATVHETLIDVAPWLGEEHFAPAVSRYLQAAAREQLLHDHIMRVTAEKGAGAVAARVWEQVTAAARLAARLGQDLGLDPIGHARLRAVAASASLSQATLADLAAEGRAAMAARSIDGTADEVES